MISRKKRDLIRNAATLAVDEAISAITELLNAAKLGDHNIGKAIRAHLFIARSRAGSYAAIAADADCRSRQDAQAVVDRDIEGSN